MHLHVDSRSPKESHFGRSPSRADCDYYYDGHKAPFRLKLGLPVRAGRRRKQEYE